MIDLLAERLDRGLTLDALAEETGVPKTTLARVERRECVPRPSAQLKIASFFGYTPTKVWPPAKSRPIPEAAAA